MWSKERWTETGWQNKVASVKFTSHKFRLALGLLTCGVGLLFLLPAIWMFFFSHGLVFYRFGDALAWLLMGSLLCFLPESEFQGRFTRNKFRVALGFLITAAGLLLTCFAILEFFSHAHGGLGFYELIGIGPLLLFTGVSFCFDSRNTA
ncbi:MAG TPA: hypothetical protein VNN22_25045 [Verrucomicrobiae bacterium]|nr:hypothetical protein [Verrucomicrobiae bacterium]